MADHFDHAHPDAPPPRRTTGADDQSGWQARLTQKITARTLLVIGRHNRTECCQRSSSSQPCGRCCLHRTACSCPTSAPILVEVR